MNKLIGLFFIMVSLPLSADFDNKCSVLIINTNDIDFVNNENDLKEIMDIIRKPIHGTKYFNPSKSIDD